MRRMDECIELDMFRCFVVPERRVKKAKRLWTVSLESLSTSQVGRETCMPFPMLTMLAELRRREKELQVQEKENSKLLANALAAKEASKMKSQFLANVSLLSV